MKNSFKPYVAGLLLALACPTPADPTPPSDLSNGEVRIISTTHRDEQTPYEEISVGTSLNQFQVSYAILGVDPKNYYYRNSLSVTFEFFFKDMSMDLEDAQTLLLSDVDYTYPLWPTLQGGLSFTNECFILGAPHGDDPSPYGDGIDDSEGTSESRAYFSTPSGYPVATTTLGPRTWSPRSNWVHDYLTSGPVNYQCGVQSANEFKVQVHETIYTHVFYCKATVTVPELSVENTTTIDDLLDGGTGHFTSAAYGMPLALVPVITINIDPGDVIDIGSGIWKLFSMVKTSGTGGTIYSGRIGVDEDGKFRLPAWALDQATNIAFRARGLTGYSGSIGDVIDSEGNLVLELFQGDVDSSNEIDSVDIDLVINHYGETPESSGWIAQSNTSVGGIDADCDGSEEVDAGDIDLVIANFGQSGS